MGNTEAYTMCLTYIGHLVVVKGSNFEFLTRGLRRQIPWINFGDLHLISDDKILQNQGSFAPIERTAATSLRSIFFERTG